MTQGDRFAGRVVFVTGAGSGIGRAMVDEFSADGADVVAVDIDEASVQETVANTPAVAIGADVGDSEQVDAAVATALERFGRIDVLCSNAGMLDDYKPAVDTSLALWDRIISSNLAATFYLSRAILPGMLERGRGYIITTCSISSFVAGGGGAAYTSSKHGLLGLTRQLAYDYGAKGVRANAICPGLTLTGMTKPLLDNPKSGAHKFVEETPTKTYAPPAEVAKLATFLASGDVPFINGAHVDIDGGWLIK